MDDESPRADRSNGVSRRTLLVSTSAVGLPIVFASGQYARDRSFEDDASDGIPDEIKRSSSIHHRIENIYGPDQFEGFRTNRADLLLDVRYVDGTSIDRKTKRKIVDRFRSNGIYAQWLDYPDKYDREWFESTYGSNAKSVLWHHESFYHTEIEPFLQNIAIQLLVVPGRRLSGIDGAPDEGMVFSPWTNALGGGWNGYVNGFSVGNRAVVANRTTQREEARLILHEIAHYGLCHATDPSNNGVMGTGEVVDLTSSEWNTLRERLPNVRDTTGYDVVLRPCLWQECLSDLHTSSVNRTRQLFERSVDN